MQVDDFVIMQRLRDHYGIDVTRDFIRDVLGVVQVYQELQAEFEQARHERIMEEINGPLGQG